MYQACTPFERGSRSLTARLDCEDRGDQAPPRTLGDVPGRPRHGEQTAPHHQPGRRRSLSGTGTTKAAPLRRRACRPRPDDRGCQGPCSTSSGSSTRARRSRPEPSGCDDSRLFGITAAYMAEYERIGNADSSWQLTTRHAGVQTERASMREAMRCEVPRMTDERYREGVPCSSPSKVIPRVRIRSGH